MPVLMVFGIIAFPASMLIGQTPMPDTGKKQKNYSDSSIVKRMLEFNKKKDGKLVKEEVTDPRLHRLFDLADTNKDGVVTREELLALAAKLDAEWGSDDKFGKGFGPKGKGPGGPKGKGPPPGGFDDKGPKGKGPGGFDDKGPKGKGPDDKGPKDKVPDDKGPKDKPAAKEPQSKELFGLDKVWQIHLEITAKEWDKMQPKGGMPFGGLFGTKKEEKPAEQDVHKGSGFGIEFPWASADISAAGQTVKNAGIRFKGNGSYMAASRGLKRNFRIDLDHYDGEGRFFGLKSVVLNAGAMDPERGREAISYAVFRAAGVPAPRTAFAEVTLTIPGKYDKEFVGIYTFVEHVDKSFLKDRFKNGKGLLLKPEKLRDIEYLGEDWKRYEDRYRPKHEPKVKEAQRVIDFARLIQKGSDEQFQKEIDSYLDVNEFLRFLAANTLVINQDCFHTTGHNYYIYLNPVTNKFVFFPWDLDLSLAGFTMMSSSAKQLDLSLVHPHAGPHKLIDRLLAMKDVEKQYLQIVKELSAGCFAKEKLLTDVAAIEAVTREPLAREKKALAARKEATGGFGFTGGFFGSVVTLRTFVEKRTASVEAQLAGTSKGYVPTRGGFGFGGGAAPAKSKMEEKK
jgi:spore coat protein CotH